MGTVSWYDTKKGFEVIRDDEDGTEVLVHFSGITMKGFRHLERGQVVSYEEEETEHGLHAINVIPKSKGLPTLRKKLRKQGFRLESGRDTYGCIGYQIINEEFNRIECGEHFELSIADVEQFANQ